MISWVGELRLCGPCREKFSKEERETGAKEVVTGAVDGVTGVFRVAGNVVKTAQGVVDTVSMDEKLQNDNKFKPAPRHVGEGLERGVISLGKGIFNGVTGIVCDPIKGFEKDGVKGFATGLVTGIVGVVAKPVSGALSLVSDTVTGIGNTADYLFEEEAVTLTQTNNANTMFGKSLEEVLNMERDVHPDAKVPSIVPKLITAIIKLGGIEEKGIFRLSASQSELDAERVRIDAGEELNTRNPHVPAALLKLWLRTLSEPIIPGDVYQQCLGIVRGVNMNDPGQEREVKDNISYIYNALPEVNQRVLTQLSYLFSKIDAKKDINSMPVSNLAIVFSPAVIRNIFASPKEAFENLSLENAFTQALINTLPQVVPPERQTSESALLEEED